VIQQEFAHTFGYATHLVIKHVEEIPREASGKFRMIKNLVEE
jgi:phenylacetate-CoA ligase